MWLFWLACTTTDVSEDIVNKFKQDPQLAYQQISIIEDPIQRLSIIELLSKQFPGQTTLLCELIDNKISQQACLTQNQRPHLWMKNKDSSTTLDTQEKWKIDCPAENKQQCVQNYASKAANANAPTKAIQICNNIDDEKWRNECIFVVAENSVKQKGPKAYASAVEMCEQAGSFSENCQQHLILQFSRQAPDSDSVSQWNTIFSAHNAIQTTWGWRDKDRQQQLQHRLWAEAIGTSFAGASKITGNSLEVIPEEFHPHVHAAAARRLFQLEEPKNHSLMEWTNILLELLQKRATKPESLNQQRKFLAVADLWEKSSHPSINYIATSRREYSSDAFIDIQICILEAIARKPPIARDLLQEGSGSKHEQVQRTALRLQKRRP